jgi:putative transposase
VALARYPGMARPPRIDFPGIPQHVIVRRNNRGILFRDEADRIIFLR